MFMCHFSTKGYLCYMGASNRVKVHRPTFSNDKFGCDRNTVSTCTLWNNNGNNADNSLRCSIFHCRFVKPYFFGFLFLINKAELEFQGLFSDVNREFRI